MEELLTPEQVKVERALVKARKEAEKIKASEKAEPREEWIDALILAQKEERIESDLDYLITTFNENAVKTDDPNIFLRYNSTFVGEESVQRFMKKVSVRYERVCRFTDGEECFLVFTL